jgi:methionine sulfoxide reductase heme-binding subunit
MSLSYQAVGWNRQKKMYDWIIFCFCLGYLVVFITLNLIFNNEVTFETLIIRSTSTLAILLLHIILSIGPLTRLNRKFLPLLYNRRHLGVTMFCIAAIHGVFSVIQFHSLGNENPIVSVFVSNTNYRSVADFPFQALGFFSLLIFALMAATSHDFWLKNLSPKVWKAMHMGVYLAYFLVIMHVLLGVIQYETHPVFIVFLSVGCILIASLHVGSAIKEIRIDNRKYILVRHGFYRVCHVDDIIEDRAKSFCIKEERIAVYKTGGKLFAVSNVCKHQNGPLGEGKIVDGCITCPWHGYQYLPHNGCSPAPFREKVSTYDVCLIEGEVWVNPNGYPEGTERPGAVINIGENQAKLITLNS